MRIIPVIFVILAALALPDVVFAHAFPRSSIPPAGATLRAAPVSVVITFSEALEPRFSTIEVHDAAGARVDANDLHTIGGDARRVAVGLKPLGAGTYKVVWHATSVDTHKTEGSFSFTIAP